MMCLSLHMAVELAGHGLMGEEDTCHGCAYSGLSAMLTKLQPDDAVYMPSPFCDAVIQKCTSKVCAGERKEGRKVFPGSGWRHQHACLSWLTLHLPRRQAWRRSGDFLHVMPEAAALATLQKAALLFFLGW